MTVRNTRILNILAVIVVARGAMAQTPPPAVQPDEDKTHYEKVAIHEVEYKLEVAADDESRAKGLMGREKLEDDKGMIFIYRTAAVRAFWMKDCLIDIDIVYLDSLGQIVAVHEMKKESPQREGEPHAAYIDRLMRYSSIRPAQYAIELKAGTIKKLELEVGETIEFDRRRLSRLAK